MAKYSHLLAKLAAQEEAIVFPPARPEAIDKWSVRNGIQIPQNLREWLLTANSIVCAVGILDGVSGKDKMGTMSRVQSLPGAIDIGSDGCGNHFMLLDAIKGRQGVVFCESPDHLSSRWLRTGIVYASSLERFLTIASMLQHELGRLWPHDRETLLRLDPDIPKVVGFRMPWEVE